MAKAPRASTIVPVLAAATALTVPVLYGLSQAPSVASASNLGVFSIFMNSPLQLVLPLIAVAVGCSRLYEEVGDRFVANLRSRLSIETYLRRTLLHTTLLPFAVFTGVTVLVGIITFVLWPLAGNPYIDPSVYHLDAGAAAPADLAAFTFSELIRSGWPAFVIFYAVLVGLACAAFSALGAAALVVLDRRPVALLVPWAVYLAETLLAALLDSAHAGLMYAIVPFGLQPVSVAEGVLPVVVLCLVVAAAWALIWRARFDLARLR